MSKEPNSRNLNRDSEHLSLYERMGIQYGLPSDEETAAWSARMEARRNRPVTFQPGSTVVPGGTATSDFTTSGESIRGLHTPGGELVKGNSPAAPGSKPNKHGVHRVGQQPQSVVDEASRKRTEWERSTEPDVIISEAGKPVHRRSAGIERTKDMSDLTAHRPAHERRTPAQHAFERNYDRKRIGPTMYDEQLPGMADPNAAPRPPRWHELSKEQQDHTTRALEEHGTSIGQIASDLGAQYDQGVYRAEKANGFGADAHAEHFYSSGEPRKKIDASAEELGIPKTIHAHMNAITSPNAKFQAQRGKGHPQAGETYYPNDEAAVHAVKHIQQGGAAATITNELESTDPSKTGKSTARPANIKKAALSFEQYEAGVPVAEWKTGKGGGGPFDKGPKTGPYSNSWNDTHPQFFVSDVHSGGGGAFPHLSSDKPALTHPDGSIQLDEDGKPKRDKSEREHALEKIPFAHSAIDEASRQAAGKRNLSSLRGFQEIQWGEEQISSGTVNQDSTVASTKNAAPKAAAPMPGQLDIFGGEAPPAPKEANQSRAQRRSS